VYLFVANCFAAEFTENTEGLRRKAIVQNCRVVFSVALCVSVVKVALLPLTRDLFQTRKFVVAG
jgi:hypothetical protein